MPLYEYECESCRNRFERIQKFSDPLVETCPSCGGAVRKLLSSPAIQFKGSGWYITDYAKKSSDGAGKDSKDTAKSDKGTTTSSESSASSPTTPPPSTTKTE
jgi:putative FmdB family regulatory protein